MCCCEERRTASVCSSCGQVLEQKLELSRCLAAKYRGWLCTGCTLNEAFAVTSEPCIRCKGSIPGTHAVTWNCLQRRENVYLHRFPPANMYWPDPFHRVATTQNQAMNQQQHHQHAETAEHLQVSQQGEPIQPAETDQLGANQGRAETANVRPEQPGPSAQIQLANDSDGAYMRTDDVDLAIAAQMAQEDFKLDFLAAMVHQACIMQGIQDGHPMQRREQRHVGAGVDLGPVNVVASAADFNVVRGGQDPSVIRVARGPFGIVRTKTTEGVVVTNLPLRPPTEMAMRDAVGRWILVRPARS